MDFIVPNVDKFSGPIFEGPDGVKKFCCVIASISSAKSSTNFCPFTIGSKPWSLLPKNIEPCFLTMIVSLEAILLSGLILSATDRESERDRQVMNRDLRISKETQKLLQHMHEELMEVKHYVSDEEECKK